MLFEAFQPPKPENRRFWLYALDGHTYIFSCTVRTLNSGLRCRLSPPGKDGGGLQWLKRARTASVGQAPPGSFDSAPPSSVSRDKSVKRSSQDDDFVEVFKKTIPNNLVSAYGTKSWAKFSHPYGTHFAICSHPHSKAPLRYVFPARSRIFPQP
jgi:hypothetical protein